MLITIALALFAVSIALIAWTVARHNKSLDRLEELDMKMVASLTTSNTDLNKRIDNVTTIHNATVEHYDEEFDGIIDRLNLIVEDIKRLDTELKYQQTRMNVVYPWFENSEYNIKPNTGVEWAQEYPTQEEEHVEDD